MCVQEHQSHVNASVLNTHHRSDKFKDYHPISDANLPDSIDWRTGGAVVKVKDQVLKTASASCAIVFVGHFIMRTKAMYVLVVKP